MQFDLIELVCIIGYLVAWNWHCLCSFLCASKRLMCLSITEQPFGDDAGLQGEQTNLDVPLGG